MNIEFNLASFVLGIITAICLGGIIAIFVASRRHRCHCGCGTHKICKLYCLPDSSTGNPPGTKLYLSYIFRECKGGDHVTAVVKTVVLTGLQIAKKPKKEFDWNVDNTQRLCRLANVPNPIAHPITQIITDHPVTHQHQPA